ncbi:MAG TPA: tetratricopeptide repeat protein [Bryobacteraceae bacterium]|jgi:tetratricopeptide (TPR) repeat protein|nr:tetratricopeptide repeat protein [Bryobacteraceae bacterium]
MFRFFAAATVLASLIAASAFGADVDETEWKNKVTAGMRAAGAHDYAKSEQELVKALHEAQRFGALDARVGTTLNSLGLVYRAEKKYGDAEASYRRALIIIQSMYGDSTDTANVNFNIAGVMLEEGHQAEALPYIVKTLATYERLFGSNSEKTAAALCMQGDAYRALKRFQEAEGPLHRCGDIREAVHGLYNSEVADALYSLAVVYVAEGKASAAEPRFKLVEQIREKTAGITSPLLAQTMEEHAAVLKSLGRDDEAAKLSRVAEAIKKSEAKGK